jgi:hypothetical protein
MRGLDPLKGTPCPVGFLAVVRGEVSKPGFEFFS